MLSLLQYTQHEIRKVLSRLATNLTVEDHMLEHGWQRAEKISLSDTERLLAGIIVMGDMELVHRTSCQLVSPPHFPRAQYLEYLPR